MLYMYAVNGMQACLCKTLICSSKQMRLQLFITTYGALETWGSVLAYAKHMFEEDNMLPISY